MFKQNVMILISAILAIAVGYFFQDYSTEINKYVKPFGTIFLNLLLWMVVPFVFVSIILSISSLKDVKSVKNIGFYTVAYFLSTTVIAVLIGTFIALSCKSLFPAISKAAIGAEAHETATFSFMDAIVNLFPSNFIELFLKGNMIQIIVAAIFIGVAMVSLGRKSASVSRVVIELNMIFSAVLKTILKAAPVAVFFLLCPVVAEHGTHILGSIGAVVLVAYICYAVHALVIYSVMLMSFSKVGPVQFFKCMVPAMVFAFSSTSSVGTIPLNMQCTRRMGVDNKISSFVLTMGANINMDGTAIFQSVIAIFIAFCYGVDLTYPQLFLLMFTIAVTSVGTAGIPSAGVLMLSVILTSVGLPIEGIAIIIGLDRIFDMGRSVVNILGDASCAVVVDAIEKKKGEDIFQHTEDEEEVDPTIGKPEYMITPEDILKKQKIQAHANRLSPEDILRQQREAKLQAQKEQEKPKVYEGGETDD